MTHSIEVHQVRIGKHSGKYYAICSKCWRKSGNKVDRAVAIRWVYDRPCDDKVREKLQKNMEAKK